MLIRLISSFTLALFVARAQEGAIDLNRWKVMAGDNPAWAAPDFDDQSWQATEAPQLYVTRAGIQTSGIRWYRTRLRLPAVLATQSLAIALPPLDEAYEVFVDGVRVGGIGSIDPSPVGHFDRHAAYPLPAQRSDTITIAIRRWAGKSNSNLVPLTSAGQIGGTKHPPRVGLAALLQAQEELHRLEGERSRSPRRATSWILLLLGLVAMVLYFEQRARREYLWLGLAMGSFGLFSHLGIVAVILDLPRRSLIPSLIVLGYIAAASWTSLFLKELAPRARWLMLCTWGISTLQAIWFFTYYYFDFERTEYITYEPAIILCAQALVAISLLLTKGQRRDGVVAVFLVLFTLVRFSGRFGLNLIDWQGYTFDLRDMALAAAALCCLAVLYLRFRDEQMEQRRQAQELAAGQRVQEFLLQSESTGTSLFEVEKAYLPALEVGGDFYQFMPRSDGSLMVVVGDVSGKGLEAAMMGARLLGALETLTDLAPGEVLSRLNQTLHRRSQGGFVTCCCALFAADGTVTIANAGHPAPYCDGLEVEVEAGLPLGIVDGMPYGESVLAGGRFCFVSDGVVEAENGQRELFGFDRTREISGKSAQEIAEAAKAWGQNDDITVVTVRRSA